MGGDLPTGAYAPSRIDTKLNVEIKEGTKAVHFIRDNNDPSVVTRAYVIKNADPYVLRGVLKTIVAPTIAENPVALESIKYVDGSNVLLVSAEEYRFENAGNGMPMDKVIEMLDKKDLPNSSGTIDMAYFPKYNPASVLLRMMKESGMELVPYLPPAEKRQGSREEGHPPDRYRNCEGRVCQTHQRACC